MRRAIVLAAAVAVFSGAAVAQTTSLLPLVPVADETGFGTLYDSLSTPYTGGGFSGQVDTRVYLDAPAGEANQVTFVYDLQVSLAFTAVSDFSIASTDLLTQYDLRIGEIIAGVNGYVTSTTTQAPDNADATNNVYPIVDVLDYEWLVGSEMLTGDRATLYVTTTGAVDVGIISGSIQDGGTSSVLVLAPVDDPTNPDLNVPEPATLALLGVGCVGMLWRRRRA